MNTLTRIVATTIVCSACTVGGFYIGNNMDTYRYNIEELRNEEEEAIPKKTIGHHIDNSMYLLDKVVCRREPNAYMLSQELSAMDYVDMRWFVSDFTEGINPEYLQLIVTHGFKDLPTERKVDAMKSFAEELEMETTYIENLIANMEFYEFAAD